MFKCKINIWIVLIILLSTIFTLQYTGIVFSQTAGKSYGISSYNVNIDVLNDGSFIVYENITIDYISGGFSFFKRYIPIGGLDYIEILSTDANGATITSTKVSYTLYQVEITIYYNTINAPAQATFNITYKVYGGILSASASQNMIDWNAIGSDWEVPIKNVNVLVRLQGNLIDNKLLSVSPYPKDIYYSNGYTNIVFSYSMLSPYTGYRIILIFPKIYEPQPDYLYIFKNYHGETIISIIILSTLCTLILWFINGRMPKADIDEELISLGVLPSKLSPLEVAFLLNRHLTIEHALSAVLDLAKRGFLEVEYDDKGKAISFNLSNKTEDALNNGYKYGLKPFEIELLHLASSSNNPYNLARNFLTLQSKIEDMVNEELIKMGYFKGDINKRRSRITYICGGILIASMLIVFFMYNYIPNNRFLFNTFRASLPIITGLGFSTIPIGIILIHMFSNYTLEGAKAYWHWKKYLDTSISVKDDELKGLMEKVSTPPQLFESIFPYILLYRPFLFYSWSRLWIPLLPGYYAPSWFYARSDIGRIALDFPSFINAIGSSIETTFRTIQTTYATARGGGIFGGGFGGRGGFGGGGGRVG